MPQDPNLPPGVKESDFDPDPERAEDGLTYAEACEIDKAEARMDRERAED